MDKNIPYNRFPSRLTPFFIYFIGKQWRWFLFAQLFAFSLALQETVWPQLVGSLVDSIEIYRGDKSGIWSYLSATLALWVGFWLLLELMFRGYDFVNVRTTPKLEADIRMALFDYVNEHSYNFFSSRYVGDVAAKIDNVSRSASEVVEQFMELFAPTILAICIATASFLHMHPMFSALILLWATLHIGICLAASKKCIYLSNEHADSQTALAGRLVDTITNFVNVKLFVQSRYERTRIGRQQQREQHKHRQLLLFIALLHIVLGISAFFLPGLGMLWFLIHNWQNGLISIGEVVLILNTTLNVVALVWYAGMELPYWFKEIGICQQALQLVQAQHDVVDLPHAAALHVPRGTICLQQVTFAYEPGHNIFNQLSVEIAAGQKVGLVGFSGSGKTTFINLLLRFFDLQSGKICIDGQEIQQVTRASLRQHIAVIPQHPTLFHRSIKENICYGQQHISHEQMLAVSKQAHCHDFIQQLPQAYDSLVGERGMKLSGGQRQRIAIARAMLKNAPILALDEATSALDSVTEKCIQDSLLKAMQGRTVIVIAHRLSTLCHMDRLLVFANGQIVEDGTHQSLLAQKGHYAHMWHMQVGGFLPS
ncbi:MAG: ABC transporter ATP-binding protein [Myxococcota bacterium]